MLALLVRRLPSRIAYQWISSPAPSSTLAVALRVNVSIHVLCVCTIFYALEARYAMRKCPILCLGSYCVDAIVCACVFDVKMLKMYVYKLTPEQAVNYILHELEFHSINYIVKHLPPSRTFPIVQSLYRLHSPHFGVAALFGHIFQSNTLICYVGIDAIMGPITEHSNFFV